MWGIGDALHGSCFVSAELLFSCLHGKIEK